MLRCSNMSRRLVRLAQLPIAEIPIFLCPSILRLPIRTFSSESRPKPIFHSPAPQRRRYSSIPEVEEKVPKNLLPQLPQQCPGCGALSHTVEEGKAGYYTFTRGSVKRYLEELSEGTSSKLSKEDEIIKVALEKAGGAVSGIHFEDFAKPSRIAEAPVCDRCHALKHHETGVSISHPTLDSIGDTIDETPHKFNHVYHVIDAADFPMSLVPGIQKLLNVSQRSMNRRSKTGKFYHGKKTEMSFIITRSDLLAPNKFQVDTMMPYLREVLRDALGKFGKDVRLGNVRCISARNGWWTKELKEDIWRRGGGGWMVGKVNVGKSKLFNEVFPKGRTDVKVFTDGPGKIRNGLEGASKSSVDIANDKLDTIELGEKGNSDLVTENEAGEVVEPDLPGTLKEAFPGNSYEEETQANQWTSPEPLDSSDLLPPVPPEVQFPTMPLVSNLPGTTASPIRLSFGNGRGELIDLPGLSRGDLEQHVEPCERSTLIMRSHINPEQKVIKPGQSLLLGGFIRITPVNLSVVVIAHPFVSISPHLTSTEKALNIQMRTKNSFIPNISVPGTEDKIKSAGKFLLKWDVTKKRAGPITDPKIGGIKPEDLPYQIMGTDILIEGVGWIELTAQIRRRPRKYTNTLPPKPGFQAFQPTKTEEWQDENLAGEDGVEVSELPAVEVFSPLGKYIGERRPMNAWLYAQKKVKKDVKGRPRKAMKGYKKSERRRQSLRSREENRVRAGVKS